MAGDDPVEAVVRERERERVALDELCVGDAGPGDGEHARALVEPGDPSAQMTREEAGAARDVERPSGGEGRERLGDRLQLFGEPVALAIGVEALPEVPVVVLRAPAGRSTRGRSARASIVG